MLASARGTVMRRVRSARAGGKSAGANGIDDGTVAGTENEPADDVEVLVR